MSGEAIIFTLFLVVVCIFGYWAGTHREIDEKTSDSKH